jgi:Mu transposase, C-terminal
MSESWLTLEKVCALTGLSKRSVRRLSRSWSSRNSEARGRNGRPEREYALNSLPGWVQAKYADETRKRFAIIRATGQTSSVSAVSSELQSPARVAIPEDLKEQAQQRYHAIESLLDFRKRTNDARTTIPLVDGRVIRTVVDFAKYVGAQQVPPVSWNTVLRWVGNFEDGGYAALPDKPRKDKGQSRFFEEHKAAALFLQNKFLQEGLSREMSWEALVREWPKIEKRGEPPCCDTARIYLNALPEPLKVLGREGKEAHERKCSPFILRGKVPVMDWWVSDHRVFDVLVRNSLFAELPQDKAFRLWFTALYDWGSRKIVGFCFAPTPSSRTINTALRIGILSHGMPRNFYWDNGEDYKKVRRDLERIVLSDEARTLLDRDGVGITSALPKHPRSKPIESWFSRWSKRFDVIWRPAYLGNKPGNCPESGRIAQKQHEDFLKGKRADSPLPGDAEFIAATIQWIDEYNETRLESLHHRTPNEVMEEAHPERNRKAVNPRLLDILFSERVTRKVQAGGCIQLERMRFEPTVESLGALDMQKGREVMVLRDPYNLGEAVAVDAETLQFIGELHIQQLVGQSPNGQITRDQIKAAMRRQRSVRRGYAEYLAALQAIASSQGWLTEREALLERAGVRTGTTGKKLLTGGGTRDAEPRAEQVKEIGLTFASDFVAKDAHIFETIEVEGKDTFPIAAVPGARGGKALPLSTSKLSSPFIDDHAAKFMAAMKEDADEEDQR